MTLYYLPDARRMRKTANVFGTGKSTVPTTVRQVTKAISTYLSPKYIDLSITEGKIQEMKVQYKGHGHLFIYLFLHSFIHSFIYLFIPCSFKVDLHLTYKKPINVNKNTVHLSINKLPDNTD